MYRIRLHGRGGQGLKTASRLMGTALFLEGFEVQDAPRYGAERRGAPIFAYVRADKCAIQERGVINSPDLVMVTDDSLVAVPSANVLQGMREHTVLLICSQEPASVWQDRVNLPGPIITIPTPDSTDPLQNRYASAQCTGAACRLTGVVAEENLQASIRDELAHLPKEIIEKNTRLAFQAYDTVADQSGIVRPGGVFHVHENSVTDWTRLRSEDLIMATPAILGVLTSVNVRTGLWRTLRPVIEYEHCNQCHWVCNSFCPDNAISVDADAYPHIDLDHCKGCMICVEQCPPHAIVTLPEAVAHQRESELAGVATS
jgi:pyruvate ferredoxin oxidoreductase gamma subunit